MAKQLTHAASNNAWKRTLRMGVATMENCVESPQKISNKTIM